MIDTSNRVKDEKHFAKTIMAKYKMSNTKNKDFVNIVLLEINEVNKYFNFDLLSLELTLLDFHIIKFDDTQKYIGIVKNNEIRKLCYKEITKISEYL